MLILLSILGSGAISSLLFYNKLPSVVKKSFNIIGIKNLEGLEIIELHPSIISRNDHYNLIINFTVYNDADMERSLPLVKLEIYDDNDAVHSYWIDLNKNHLSPNEYYKFEYKILALDFDPAKIELRLNNGINKYVNYTK